MRYRVTSAALIASGSVATAATAGTGAAAGKLAVWCMGRAPWSWPSEGQAVPPGSGAGSPGDNVTPQATSRVAGAVIIGWSGPFLLAPGQGNVEPVAPDPGSYIRRHSARYMASGRGFFVPGSALRGAVVRARGGLRTRSAARSAAYADAPVAGPVSTRPAGSPAGSARSR